MFDDYHNCSHWKKQEHLTKSRLMMEDIDDDFRTDLSIDMRVLHLQAGTLT